jgi:hypothetical protein
VTIETVATPDLPVIWWVFWLVVMAVGVFAALAWWLTRAALREDSEPPADHDEGRPQDP